MASAEFSVIMEQMKMLEYISFTVRDAVRRIFEADLIARADLRYVGNGGLTQSCIRAIETIIQTEGVPDEAVVLSCNQDHCLFLHGYDLEQDTIVEQGFGSGYYGEGAKGLSWAVSVLEMLGTKLFEVDVDIGVMRRIERHALSDSDVDIFFDRKVRRDSAFRYARDLPVAPVFTSGKWPIPIGHLDQRLVPNVINILKNADSWSAELANAYAIVEDAIRHKVNSTGFDASKLVGVRLIKAAFGEPRNGNVPEIIGCLEWIGLSQNETWGRSFIYRGAFQAFRNKRAHNIVSDNLVQDFAELFLVNMMLSMEKDASPVASFSP